MYFRVVLVLVMLLNDSFLFCNWMVVEMLVLFFFVLM